MNPTQIKLVHAHFMCQRFRQLTHALPEGRAMLSSPYFQSLEADVHFLRGEAYSMKGQKEAALKAYQRVVEIDPDRRDAHDRLARRY